MGEVSGKFQAWLAPRGWRSLWNVTCTTEGWASGPLCQSCLGCSWVWRMPLRPLQGVVIPPKPRAGLQKRSQVLAVSSPSQHLGVGVPSEETWAGTQEHLLYPQPPTNRSQEHWAFMPIIAQVSDTRTCSQLSQDENQANLAPGLP